MKFKIFKFKRIKSTNDSAINLIKAKKKVFGFVYAETQTKGRGTHGKKWISKTGNLFGSIFFPLENNYPTFKEFAIISPILISDVIKIFCKKNNKISIKWPNDLFLNKKKFCGILQEVITNDKTKFLIIGIGINLISNPLINNRYETTNILLESNKKPSKKKVIQMLVKKYEDFFNNLNLYKFTNFKNKANLLSIN